MDSEGGVVQAAVAAVLMMHSPIATRKYTGAWLMID